MLQILATIMNYFTVNYQGFYKNGQLFTENLKIAQFGKTIFSQ